MGGQGRRADAYYARGLLEIRTSLHLSLRLILRANQVIQRSGAASQGSGTWRPATILFIALDLAIYLQLRRDDRFGLWWRLPVDAVDTAFWVMSPLPASGHADAAILVAVPLAIEAGVRLGWRGLAVPLFILMSTSVGAAVAGKPLQLSGVGWIVLAVAMGVCFLRYCRHLGTRARAGHEQDLAAARRLAYLGGQNQVAMGASSAVDVMEGLVPVLGRPEAGSALWRLANGWKSQLSASTAREAEYLQAVLLEWERAHNRHPDLSGLAQISVEDGHGTTLLTASQALQLRGTLDELGLQGGCSSAGRRPRRRGSLDRPSTSRSTVTESWSRPTGGRGHARSIRARRRTSTRARSWRPACSRRAARYRRPRSWPDW